MRACGCWADLWARKAALSVLSRVLRVGAWLGRLTSSFTRPLTPRHTANTHNRSVLQKRVLDPHPFHAYQDPDPGFEISADPDPGFEISADPNPGFE